MKVSKDYINLLPEEERKPAIAWLGPGTLFVLLFVLAWGAVLGWQFKQKADAERRIKTLALQKQGLQRELDVLHRELGITAAAGTDPVKARIVNDLMRQRVSWSEVFRQFSRIVPKGMWFDSVEGSAGDRPVIRIKGGAFSYPAISEFMLALENSGYFSSPELLYAQKSGVQGQDTVGFEIQCGVRKEQGAR